MVGIVDKALPGGAEDALKIGSHINALTSFVRDTSTPMTVGIQGDWGSGKTSLCNQIYTQLENCSNEEGGEEKYKQIWVNAWEHSLLCSPEESLIKIINQIIEELIDADQTKTKAESIKKNVKNVLHGAMRIGGAVALGAAGKDLAEGMIDDSSSSIAKLRKDLSDLAKEIQQAETNPYSKIVIYVDDLDRIVPENAVQVLELLKNIFDIDGCVFILAIDYSVVVKGLEKKFGEKNDANDWEFRAFFDKIIQLPFRMPISDYDLGDYIIDLLGKIDYTSNDIELDDDLLEDLVKDSIGTNPRSIKRLINSLCLIKILTDENLGDDGDVDELLGDKNQATVMFALVCLQVAFPEVYDLLSSYPDFWNWNKATALKVTHGKEEKSPYDNFEEDFKSATTIDGKVAHPDFDEEWEKALFRICYINPKYQSKINLISRFMSTLLEDVITEQEVPDKNQRMQKLFDLIDKGLTQTSVTSVSSSDATTIRPKKGDNKRFKEKGIVDWYDRKLQSDKINIPDWCKETIESIIEVWKSQPFNAVDSSEPNSDSARYRIDYATRISLYYDKRKVAEIEIDKKYNIKLSVLRSAKYSFSVLTINDFVFDLRGAKIVLDPDTKTYNGSPGYPEWMRGEINLANRNQFSPNIVSLTLKEASTLRDNEFLDQPNGKLINEKIAIYEKRQRNSQAWQDAVKYLEHYYSDKNRKKISIK